MAAVWSVVPFPIMLAHSSTEEFAAAWSLWLTGSAITAGLTAVAVILSRRRVGEWLVALWRRTVAAPPERVFTLAAASVFATLTLAFTLFVLEGNPHNVDGFAELFQARIFLAGRLWVPPPAELAHFSTLQMVLGPDRWFSQYPPGQPAVLSVGLALGAWWLLNLGFAVLLVWGTSRLARWTAGETVARLAAVLLCVSPFAVAIAGTEMNHLPAAVLGIWAAVLATRAGDDNARRWTLGSGLLLGLMTAFRPLDAVAAAVPVALVIVGSTRGRLGPLAPVVMGGVVGTLPTLWFNSRTTGHWLEFGYTRLWGPLHSLGFHDVPFGIPLTPARALGLTGVDLYQLNRYLFDLPFPVLLFVAVAWVVGRRRLTARDGVPLVAVASLVGLLFFFWHRDILFGPRFLYSVMPWLVIMTARSVHLVRHAKDGDASTAGPTTVAAFAIALGMGVATLTPTRLTTYRESTVIFKYHPDRDARAAGISNAVVFIPDGWGSRLIARMWADGVPLGRSTRLYAGIDACSLHRALDDADRRSLSTPRLLAVLDSLEALGRPGVTAEITADRNLRLPNWEPVAPECVDELNFDQRGFIAFASYLYLNNASLDGDIVWARDMRSGNRALARRYPGRRFYRYETGPAGPRFREIDPSAAPTTGGDG